MIYLLDSNTISDFLARQPQAVYQFQTNIAKGDSLGLCRPVYYEVLRGLLWRQVSTKLQTFNRSIGMLFTWFELADGDWEQAALFWASMRSAGRQLADTDLLLAAMAYRLNTVVVSSDQGFDPLPTTRIDWRLT